MVLSTILCLENGRKHENLVVPIFQGFDLCGIVVTWVSSHVHLSDCIKNNSNCSQSWCALLGLPLRKLIYSD